MSKFCDRAAALAVFLCMAFGPGCDWFKKTDFSGRYHVCFGAIPRVLMDISCDGDSVTFIASGGLPVLISGGGTIDGDDISLTADISGLGIFSAEMTTLDHGETFAGNCRITGLTRMEATITGQRDPWPVFDLDLAAVPRLATNDAIDLDKIARVSKFRSGEGHDYSDDFESCRSMKHYFFPKDGVPLSTVRLYSPINGTVIGTNDEYESGTLWKGTQVGIRPDGFDAFWVSIFHIHLDSPLSVGDHVTAGQLLGTSEKISGTVSDVAFGVHTSSGDRLLSFFDLMNDAVFSIYSSRGVASRASAIISRAERDADPLTCSGETFLDAGHLPNWLELN